MAELEEMTNHPDRTRKNRYFKVCPRGFANEVRYYRVPLDKVAEVEAIYGPDGSTYTDNHVDRNGFACWTADRTARIPGVAINWDDRS